MPLHIEGMTPLLQVYDMPTSLRFYRDVLGFEVTMDAGGGDDTDWCLLQRPGAQLMLNTRYEKPDRPATPDLVRVDVHDDTALFFGSPDVHGAWQHLVSLGIDVQPPVTVAYGMTQVWLKDPDGYTICFQWPSSS